MRVLALGAVSIDPDTARTALASDVDNHYLLRYGTLLASSFLEGMGDAVLSAYSGNNNSLFNFSIGNEEPTLRTTPREQVIAGFGRIGQRIGSNINLINRPATITVDAGTPMGLLILQDVTLDVPAPTGRDVTNAQGFVQSTATTPGSELAGLANALAAEGQSAGIAEQLGRLNTLEGLAPTEGMGGIDPYYESFGGF